MTQATRLTDLPADQLTAAQRQRLRDAAEQWEYYDLIAQQEQRRLERAYSALLGIAAVLAGLATAALLYV